MKYILEYFDAFIEDVSDKFKAKLRDDLLYKDITKEREFVQNHLRNEFYGLADNNSNKRIERYASRIIFIHKEVINKINTIEFDLVIYYTSYFKEFRVLESYYCVYEQLSFLINMITNEFQLHTNLIESDKKETVNRKTRQTFIYDHKNILKCLREKDDSLPEKIVNNYKLMAEEPDIVFKLKEVIESMDQDSVVDNLENDSCAPEIRFLQHFLTPLTQFRRTHVKQLKEFRPVFEFAKYELTKYDSIEEKEKWIIAFYIHTGYGNDVVKKYIDSKIQFYSNQCADIENQEFKIFYLWLKKTTSIQRYAKYSSEEFGFPNTLKKEVEEILQQLNDDYSLGSLQDGSNENEEHDQINQLVFHKTAKEFGVFIDAIDSVKLFPNNDKKEVAYAFASVISKIGGKHLENMSSAWTKDSEEAEYFEKKLNSMVRHIATKESKKK